MRLLARSGWAAALAACSCGAALAAQDQPSRVLDLEYRIQDLGGRVQDLNIRETETEIRIEMAADVLFDFDKADIKREATPSLEKVAAVLAGHPQARVSIEGHTDGKGSADYNQKLSLRRASSVAHWLEARKELEGPRLHAPRLRSHEARREPTRKPTDRTTRTADRRTAASRSS